jgi:eukaryotic-like serine/threonine-protein kinase
MDDTEARPPARSDSEFEHEVMAWCVEAWHANGNAGIDAVLSRHPQLAERLRERLAKLERAGLLGPADDTSAEIPEQLGEFKLLRRLGSGGMGVVFLAEQLTLGRTVALKLVRPEQRFFPGARARFRREVEAIARLGDAGIVPIYSVGEDAGVDFFAMEYVRGASLGDVLAAVHSTPVGDLTGRDIAVVAAARAEIAVPEPLPEVFTGTWVQACCRIVARMARAAHHAHERGVVHRDLKPNNTMVTPDGRVLLLDFGLAAAAGSARITRSGAMLGTLHYMAPEQVRDGEADVRTDVYALGVTLHELLALRSPFHAEESERLRQQILHGRAGPLRAANPDVPQDLQTLVAVAMDRDPARRYATAQVFADDLERFLQHRPIRARPIGLGLRGVRWSQRHPALATAALLLLVAIAATPFLVRLSQWYADAEIAEAQQAKALAQQRSRANLGSALAAIEGVLKNSNSPAMTQTPGFDPERRRQANDAMRMVSRLWRENPDDPEVQIVFVRARVRMAEIDRMSGDHEAVLAGLAEAEPVLLALRQNVPDAHLYDVDFVGLQLARGTSFAETGRVAEAIECWQRIVAAHDASDVKQLDTKLVLAMASAHNNLGRVAHSANDFHGAMRHMQRSLELEATIDAKDLPADREIDHVRTLMNVATILIGQGDPKAAKEKYELVQQRLTAALARMPDHPELLREQARTHAGVAELLARAGQYAAAVPLREQALATLQPLLTKFPDRVVYRAELAEYQFDLSVDQQMAGDMPNAEKAARAAIELAEQVVAKAPANLEHPTQLARYLRQLSGILYKTERVPEATKVLTRGVELQAAVVRECFDDPVYRLQAAQLLQELALHHANEQRWQQAREALWQARDHYDVAAAKGSTVVAEERRLPKLLMVLAQFELMCDDLDGVVKALAKRQQVRPLPARALRQAGADLHVDDRADFAELLRAAEAAGK